MGLRRSERKQRKIYNNLNQSVLLNPHLKNYVLMEANRRLAGGSGTHRSTQDGPSTSRRLPREVLNLYDEHTDLVPESGDDEEIVDIHSRVRRCRRRMNSHGSNFRYTLPQSEDSNQSLEMVPDSPTRRSTRRSSLNETNDRGSGEETEDSDDDIDEQKRRYDLREHKPITKRFESQLPEPKRRRLEWYDKGHAPNGNARDTSHHAEERSRAFRGIRRRRRQRRRYNSDSSSSSSSCGSDLNDSRRFEKKQARQIERARSNFLPLNRTVDDLRSSTFRERCRAGNSGTGLDPMQIDSCVNFDGVGGLQHHVQSLKEMVLFPLMYPEVFEKFKISPPRGVIFYGPPGTGKTLLARALANECSRSERKVSFFMRKGADCLTKWLGESERQLRLLFDQAYIMRPSIIFFDELDGLAPVRSSRQDQIHSSIVSTLLALMDGLDQRQDVVVIGATNRLDSIDPALRRPGRFDRELSFRLPDSTARQEILKIQTCKWRPALSDHLLKDLAARCVGFCGADLKGLCTEATLIALRRRYPQIYSSKCRLLLDVNSIEVTAEDLDNAMRCMVPSTQRGLGAPTRVLGSRVRVLLNNYLSDALAAIPNGFLQIVDEAPQRGAVGESSTDLQSTKKPIFALESRKLCLTSGRLLICGNSADFGQTSHLAPAVLHSLDHLPVYSLAIHHIYSALHKTPEEAIAEIIHNASRGNTPSVLYLPNIDAFERVVSDAAWHTFSSLLASLHPATPLLLIVTAHLAYHDLSAQIQALFGAHECVEITAPNAQERRVFFEPLFLHQAFALPPLDECEIVLEELPEAPPAPLPKLSGEELESVRRDEQKTLREFRIFLRDGLAQLMRDKKLALFQTPVNIEDVPDYLEIVERPMDLSEMMKKIDDRVYELPDEFLADVDLIVQNALQYNPDRELTDKIIRHRAYALQDSAFQMIDQLNPKFERQLKEVREARIKRGEVKDNCSVNGHKESTTPQQATTSKVQFSFTQLKADPAATLSNTPSHDAVASAQRAERVARRSVIKAAPTHKNVLAKHTAAIVKKYKQHRFQRQASSSAAGTPSDSSMWTDENITDADRRKRKSDAKCSTSSSAVNSGDEEDDATVLLLDRGRMEALLNRLISGTEYWAVVSLERLYLNLCHIVERYASQYNRLPMIEDLQEEIVKAVNVARH